MFQKLHLNILKIDRMLDTMRRVVIHLFLLTGSVGCLCFGCG